MARPDTSYLPYESSFRYFSSGFMGIKHSEAQAEKRNYFTTQEEANKLQGKE